VVNVRITAAPRGRELTRVLQLHVEPENDTERMLLDAWLRYDQNAIYAAVERTADDAGDIVLITLTSSQAQ
jgi:hypothetical protein